MVSKLFINQNLNLKDEIWLLIYRVIQICVFISIQIKDKENGRGFDGDGSVKEVSEGGLMWVGQSRK
ncbi:hypothetical protein LguiA_005666 [Lonicera macranthoides]